MRLGALYERSVYYVQRVARLRVSLYAANACYFLVLSAFPMLILLLNFLRWMGLRADSLIQLLAAFFPQALLPGIQKLVQTTYRASSGVLLSVSAFAALWSAGRGIQGLRTGLNSMYRVREDRGYFYTRWISVGYTFAFLAVLMLTLVLHVFGGELQLPEGLAFLLKLPDMRFFILLFLQTALFAAMYTVLPNRKNRVRDAFPGAMLASLGWMVFSDLFSFYVSFAPGYTAAFGSAYTIAMGMLWLYFCVSIIFYGGALNRFLSANSD